MDVCFVEAGRDALAESGYFELNGVDADVLRGRLLARKDVKQRETLQVVARLGEKGSAKRVEEYIYPTEYRLRLDSGSGVEFDKYKMREVGATVQAETALTDVEGQISVKFDAELVDAPEWVSRGVLKADGDGARSDVALEQPIFPAVRFGADAKVKLGHTSVFGGVAAPLKGGADKVVLAFVKVDRVRPAQIASAK